MEGKPMKLKAGAAKQRERDGRKPCYGPEVIESLRRIWTFFWYRCGKLLTPLLWEQMPFFEAWPDFAITPDIKAKLLAISPAAIDRALKKTEKSSRSGASATLNRENS
jgi:hypothetical protein